jgi:hypothetical protein
VYANLSPTFERVLFSTHYRCIIGKSDERSTARAIIKKRTEEGRVVISKALDELRDALLTGDQAAESRAIDFDECLRMAPSRSLTLAQLSANVNGSKKRDDASLIARQSGKRRRRSRSSINQFRGRVREPRRR